MRIEVSEFPDCDNLGPMRQIFILSPAKTSGERAKLIFNPAAKFALACRLREPTGAPLADVFSFLSGLYFRGKVTYARAFACAPRGIPGTLVVTSNRGLLPVETPVTLEDVRAFSSVPVDPKDARYSKPLIEGAAFLSKVLGPNCNVVFLGSVGTRRYVEPLLESFGERLLFPSSFVGRGDMSRGGLLLRAAADQRELEYAPLAGAVRHGKRPEKLPPKKWGFRILEGATDLKPASTTLPRSGRH